MQRRGSSDAQRDTSQGEEAYPPTKHCGAYRREDDGSGGARSGSEAETASTAPNSTRGAKRGFFSGRSRAEPSRVRRLRQDSPPTAYMYTPSGAKDAGIGRSRKASTVARNKAAHWKANQPSTGNASEPQAEKRPAAAAPPKDIRRLHCSSWPRSPGGRHRARARHRPSSPLRAKTRGGSPA